MDRVVTVLADGKHHGFPYIILQLGERGYLCGYVGVPEGHSLYRHDYEDLYDLHDLDVHGGITFADMGGRQHWPDGFWWFGFDCAHCGDYIPAHDIRGEGPRDGETYKDAAYVEAECRKLASQLDDIEAEAD